MAHLTECWWALCRSVTRGAITIPDLATKLPWPKKGVHRLLMVLEHAGLVRKERIEAAKHGTKQVTLTETGRDAIEHGMERAVAVAPVVIQKRSTH